MTVSEFQEILDEYFQSTRELLESAEQLLMEMEREEGTPAPEHIQDLKRTFHTLKGNTAMMGFDVVANLAHLMEDLLGGVGRGDVLVEDELLSALLAGMGLVSEVVRQGQVPEATPASWEGVIADLKRAAASLEAAPAAAPAPRVEGRETAPSATDDLARRYLGARAKSLRVDQTKLDTLLELTGEIHILLTGLDERVGALSKGDDGLAGRLGAKRRRDADGDHQAPLPAAQNST